MSCACGYINCASCSRRSSLQEYASSLEHTLKLRNDELAKCRADFAVAIRELHDVVSSREHHIVSLEKERDELHAKAGLLEAIAEHTRVREARATIELLHAENAALQDAIAALRAERQRRQ